MKKIILAWIFLIFANVASAAAIDRAYYFGNPDVSYPLIITNDDAANLKINKEIRAEIQKFIDAVNRQMVEGNFNSVALNVDYQIPCNHEHGILSIILNEYVNFEGSAHPSTYLHGLSFNSSNGERILAADLSEIAKNQNDYTPAELTKKLRAYATKNNIHLFADFQQLNETPDDFYFDDNLHVHFLFQQYEVAPYAVGIIDLDADATY